LTASLVDALTRRRYIFAVSKIISAFFAAATVIGLAGCASTDHSDDATGPLGKSHEALYGAERIHYVTTGRGAHTVVLVHCWAGNLTLWRGQVPALRDKARLILIDLPGHGLSDKPQTNYSMDYFAGAVLAVMNDAHADTATLVGHSMGTPVICRVYARAPDKVAALVAVDGTLRRPGMTGGDAEQFIARMNGAQYRTVVTNLVKSMFPIPGTETLRDATTAELLKTPQYVMASAMRGMFGADVPDWALGHVSIPVICINTDSAMWDDDYKTYVRSVSPKAEYRTLPGTGHWLMLEKPEEFNATLVESLQEFGLISR